MTEAISLIAEFLQVIFIGNVNVVHYWLQFENLSCFCNFPLFRHALASYRIRPVLVMSETAGHADIRHNWRFRVKEAYFNKDLLSSGNENPKTQAESVEVNAASVNLVIVKFGQHIGIKSSATLNCVVLYKNIKRCMGPTAVFKSYWKKYDKVHRKVFVASLVLTNMLLQADFQRNLRVLEIFHKLKLNPLRILKVNDGTLLQSPKGLGKLVPRMMLFWGMIHGFYVAVRTVQHAGTHVSSVDNYDFLRSLSLLGASMVCLWWYWAHFLRYPDLACAVFNMICASSGKLSPPTVHVIEYGIVPAQPTRKPNNVMFQSEASKPAALDGMHIQGKIGLWLW